MHSIREAKPSKKKDLSAKKTVKGGRPGRP